MLESLLDVEHLPHAAFGAVAGMVMFFKGFVRLRTARVVENTPTSRIRSLPLGSVEVIGSVRAAEPLEGPLSGKSVAYYEVLVEEYRRSRNHSRWVRIHREASSEPFSVHDGTGHMLVLPDGSDTHLPHDYRHEAGTFAEVPAHIEAALANWNIRRGFFGRGRLRFTERHLQDGDTVYVYGVAQERPDMRHKQAERVNEKLRELRADPDAMQAVDIDGDGHISDDEWDYTRVRAVAEAREELQENRIVIAKGRSGEMFLISENPANPLQEHAVSNVLCDDCEGRWGTRQVGVAAARLSSQRQGTDLASQQS